MKKNKLMIRFTSIFIVIPLIIVGCNGSITDDFVAFEHDGIQVNDSANFHAEILPFIKTKLRYSFVKNNYVSFYSFKNEMLMSTRLKSIQEFDFTKKLKYIGNKESKTGIIKGYYNTAYYGADFHVITPREWKADYTVSTLGKKVIITREKDFLRLTGYIANFGINNRAGTGKYIFLAYDNAVFTKKKYYYMDILMLHREGELYLYILYSKNKLKANITEIVNLD